MVQLSLLSLLLFVFLHLVFVIIITRVFSPCVVQSNPVVKSEKATFWYFDLFDDVDEEDKIVLIVLWM